MKQVLHELKTNCQTKLDIVNAKSRKSRILFNIPLNTCISDIFLIRNKGKGPPGRTLDSGMAYCLIRNDKPIAFGTSHPEPVEGMVPEPVEGKVPVKNELITHINKSTFLSQLNFTIMKKQILFLVLAFFAVSLSTAYGQWTAVPTTVTTLTGCNSDPLHPMAGAEYTYTVSVAAPYTATTGYTWFVTQKTSFIGVAAADIIPKTGDVIAIGTGDLYNDPLSTNTIKITWSSAAMTSPDPYFLVIQYKATNTTTGLGVTCDAMNLKVYKILPMSSFSLDIASMFAPAASSAVGSTVTYMTCSPDVVSATYDAVKDEVDYDFGKKYLYVEVLAANFNESWTPTVTVGGLATGQTVSKVEYSADPTFGGTNTAMTADVTGLIWTGGAIAAVTPLNTAPGERTYVRVEITNGDFEGKIDSDITIAVDGVDKLLKKDLSSADCLPHDLDDQVTQKILARPVVTDAIPEIPNPTNFIPNKLP